MESAVLGLFSLFMPLNLMHHSRGSGLCKIAHLLTCCQPRFFHNLRMFIRICDESNSLARVREEKLQA